MDKCWCDQATSIVKALHKKDMEYIQVPIHF